MCIWNTLRLDTVRSRFSCTACKPFNCVGSSSCQAFSSKSSWYEENFVFEGADAKCKICNCIIKWPHGATSAMEKHFIANHPSFAASPKNEKKRTQQSPGKPLEQSTLQLITPIPQMEKVNLCNRVLWLFHNFHKNFFLEGAENHRLFAWPLLAVRPHAGPFTPGR